MNEYVFIYLTRSSNKPNNSVIEAPSVWEAWRWFRKTHMNALTVLNIRVT